MFIKKRNKIILEVTTITEFEEFIRYEGFYKFFIKFNEVDRDKILSLIEETEFISYKQIKPKLKSILQYPDTVYNPLFLRCMGWSDEDITEFIKNRQKDNSKKLIELKKLNPEYYGDKTTTNIKYWLKKGFNEDQAKELLKQRQSTFSLKKCIEKYGEETGLEVFNKRQEKWINTLKNKEDYKTIQKKKNFFKYDSKSQLEILENSGFKKEINKIVSFCCKNESLDNFVDCVITKDDIKKYSDIIPYIKSKIIQKFYNTNENNIKDKFYSKIDLNQNKQYYGVAVYHNKIRYKSVSEYRFALFLEENSLSFIYEKNYPNSNMKCDFYLQDFDIYIELYGLLNKKNLNKLDDKLKLYFEKMLSKNKFCEDNKINLIYDYNHIGLINKLKQII